MKAMVPARQIMQVMPTIRSMCAIFTNIPDDATVRPNLPKIPFLFSITPMTQGNAPRVSIVMPTYNRSDLLSRSIESIHKQTFMDWELVVTDDASTDDTWQVLMAWAAKDSRIKPHRNITNQYPDISKILNDGLARSQGEYIARLDDDDYWIDAEKLAKQVAYLDAHPDCVIVGTGVVVIDGAGNERYRYLKKESDVAIRMSALSTNPFTHSSVLFRRSVALAAGLYERQYSDAEDWGLWLAMGMRGTFYNIPAYSLCYLMAGQNKSAMHQRRQYAGIVRMIWRYRNAYPRFVRGFVTNCAAYVYMFLPAFLRKIMHAKLALHKRTL
jgi:glycosyltransferase involved in cell wall biosynthesis